MLTTLKTLSLMLFMTRSMSVPICNCFHARRANISKRTTFYGGTRLWRPPTQISLNLRDRHLDCWNLRLMLKIWYADCLNLSPDILSQFIFAAAKNCEKFIKIHYFGGSRPFKIIDVDNSKKPVISTYYDKQHVCTYLQPFSPPTSQ